MPASCAFPCRSRVLLQVLPFELPPFRSQAVAGQNIVESVDIESIQFQKLDDAGVILGTSRAKRNRDQMLCRHHPGFDAFNRCLDRSIQGLLFQSIVCGEELNRPVSHDNVCTFRLASSRYQEFVKRRKAEEQTIRRRWEQDKDIQIHGRRRLQIEGRPDRTADRILPDHAAFLHLIDKFQRASHSRSFSTPSIRHSTANADAEVAPQSRGE